MIVIGIDPSSRATGVVVLRCAKGEALEVMLKTTIRPKGADLATRCVDLYEGILSLPLRAVVENAAATMGYRETVNVVIEDPTDYPYAGQRHKNAGGAAGKVGAAFGACVAALSTFGWPIKAIPSQRWLPRIRGSRGSHLMPHKLARTFLRRQMYPHLESATDDEVFAAGVALYGALRPCRSDVKEAG